jgi:hypothetical protein
MTQSTIDRILQAFDKQDFCFILNGKPTLHTNRDVTDEVRAFLKSSLEELEKKVRGEMRGEYAKKCLQNYAEPETKEWYQNRFQILFDLIRPEIESLSKEEK